jgi:hypothetical protein
LVPNEAKSANRVGRRAATSIQRRPRRRVPWLVAAALVGWATACSAVLGGIETGVLVADGGKDGSPPEDRTVDGTSHSDVPIEVGGEVLSPSGDGGCPRAPDPASGVFVSTSLGDDAMGCGAQGAPCKTITAGIAAAFTKMKPIVYVSSGVYAETVTLQGGVHIFGGYSPAWMPICTDANQAVTIQAPDTSNMTVVGSGLHDVTQIADLTIASKPTANAGESLYGVFVTSSPALLELDDVVLTVAKGGDGDAGAAGGAGANGADAGCSDNSGADASTAGGPGKAAGAGSFGSGGYQPSSGSTGESGNAGASGPLESKSGCLPCLTCESVAVCVITDAGKTCGQQGKAGCGGQPGQGGLGGGGGGSSIGVFVWGATVHTSTGSIQVEAGGAGGPGGSGGPGGTGGMGGDGPAGMMCTTSCGGVISCTLNTGEGPGGRNGNGGNGSGGGTGGGGSGGSCYAAYAGGGGTFTHSGTNITVGAAGKGAGGAPSGMNGVIGP